jgi:hypothetical protein
MSVSGSSDSGAGFFGVVFFGVLFAGLAFYRWRQLAAIRRGMMLAGAIDARIAGVDGAVGTIHGRLVRYVTVSGNKRGNGYTKASAPLPPGAAMLELHLKPESARDKELVRRGEEVDVIVGEPVFDGAFVVEAAPAHTARALLDAPTRSTLRALLPCELHIAAGQVEFRKGGVLIEPAEVSEIALLVGGLAARMPDLGLEQEERQLRALHTAQGPMDGYRGIGPGETASRLAEGEGAREMAHLGEVRRRRAHKNALFAVTVGVFCVIAFFALLGLMRR